MRRICFFLICLGFPLLGLGADIPQPQGWVNDFAKVISSTDLQRLNALITQVEEKTGSEIAVVTVDSIAPYDEKEYARMLFDNWKPGKKGKDNGVLVLLAIKERLWRIETGYGVEGILPDGLCGEIGRNYMVPYFKQANYGEGLYQGVRQISAILSGEIKPEGIRQESKEPDNDAGKLLFYPAFFILLFTSWRIYLTLLVISILWVIVLRKFIFLPVLVIVFMLTAIFKIGRLGRRGTFVGGWGGGGGGGFGGFGGGGGGFGGFGGGFGGGGGAGGRF